MTRLYKVSDDALVEVTPGKLAREEMIQKSTATRSPMTTIVSGQPHNPFVAYGPTIWVLHSNQWTAAEFT